MAVVDSVCLSILEATTYRVGMKNLDKGTVGEQLAHNNGSFFVNLTYESCKHKVFPL
jgi:hypothetical protein